jgi:hypothetical protein
MIDGIVAVALEKRPRYRPLSHQARALNAARMCYDHLAGRLSVDLTDSFAARDYVVLDGEVAEITRAGTRFLTKFGIELPRCVRPAATIAGCVSIGPSDAHTSRGRSGPRSPSATSISAGWKGRTAATR